jgi:hypothetical protein
MVMGATNMLTKRSGNHKLRGLVQGLKPRSAMCIIYPRVFLDRIFGSKHDQNCKKLTRLELENQKKGLLPEDDEIIASFGL